jgi:hypothetical protein
MIHTKESAYRHSIKPRGTGQYAIRLVEAGWTPQSAIQQAAIEHGFEQAEEFAAACRAQCNDKRARTIKGWLSKARRAITTMDE